MSSTTKDRRSLIWFINILVFIFTFSVAIPVYINSTFITDSLSTIWDHQTAKNLVGVLYTLGSIATTVGILCIPTVLNRFGNYKTTLFLVLIMILLLLGFAFTTSPFLIIPMFIAYFAATSFVYLNLDIFLEKYSKDNHTGEIRGVFLTVLNTALLISPLIAGILITTGGYTKLYLISAVLMMFMLVLFVFHFRGFKDPTYSHTDTRTTLKLVLQNKNIYNIFMAGMLLRFFYAWMVIYMPIYLHEHIGFAWSELGLIFSIMLLPFVLFEWPAGKLADTKWGEKEILTLGFLITGVSTICLVFINTQTFWLWVIALFITRTGASLIEVTTESYFFKQINASDTNIISFYRNARPVAYIIAPVIATILFYITDIDFKHLFLILGFIMFIGIWFSHKIIDTR